MAFLNYNFFIMLKGGFDFHVCNFENFWSFKCGDRRFAYEKATNMKGAVHLLILNQKRIRIGNHL